MRNGRCSSNLETQNQERNAKVRLKSISEKTVSRSLVAPNEKGTRTRALSQRPFFVLRLGLLRESRGRPFREICSRLLGEAGHCFGFTVVNVEHREQLGNLQHFLELAAQVRQFQ